MSVEVIRGWMLASTARVILEAMVPSHDLGGERWAAAKHPAGARPSKCIIIMSGAL
jgi:hypothetical protein